MVFVLAAIAAIAFAIWRNKVNQARMATLVAWASKNGFSYTEEDDSVTQLSRYHPFDTGHSRRATSVLNGTDAGRNVLAFDYSYVTTSTDAQGHSHSETHHYVVVAIDLPCGVPEVQCTAETLLTKAGHFLIDDIELESIDFNDRFVVRGADKKFATDVLNPRTMQALLDRPEVDWRFEGSTMLAWYQGTLEVADLETTIGTMRAVLDGVPEYLWRDHGAKQV